jgi:hypothetical protein
MRPLTVLAFALALAAPAAAQEKGGAHARAVAPFLDPQTFVVAHADLTRVDAARIATLVRDMTQEEGKELDEHLHAAGELLANIRKAGAKDIYLVASMADLPANGPFYFVPLEGKDDGEALGKLLTPPGGQFKHAVIHQAVVVGREAGLERLRNLKSEPRPEVAPAFEAAGDTTAQVLLLPTDDNRKVIEQLLPALPPQLGGGKTRVFTQGVRWAALGVEGPPKISARLVVQSPNADAARALHEGIENVYKKVAGLKEAKELLPHIDQLTVALLPAVKDDRLTLEVDAKTADQVLTPTVRRLREQAARMVSANNLKQIALAMHNYHATYNKGFPAAYSTDKDGKPLLSWRVHILPFIEQDALYREFHLDEPWDSEHNKKLIPRMPQTYRSSNKRPASDGLTSYLTPRGDSTIFPGKEQVKISDITDGTSDTILVVEANDDQAVVWTKPDDLKVDLKKPKTGLFGRLDGKCSVAFADGSVRVLNKTIKDGMLKAYFTRNGGEVSYLQDQ